MTNLSIGATHISDKLISIQSTIELDNDNSLYELSYRGKKIFLIYNMSGYFEIDQSFIEKNNLNNAKDFKNQATNNLLFFKELLEQRETKFICSSITLDEEIYENEKIKESFKKYRQILDNIESSLKRGAKMWYFSLYQKSFFNYAYPEVYLTKDGFTFENGIEVFSPITKRTIKTNLDKLKRLNLLDYKYKKEKIYHLKFNLNKFPLPPELIPSIFSSAFYKHIPNEHFEPINNQLKKVDMLEEIFSKNNIKIDYVAKQLKNKQIGEKSEQIVLEFEIERLQANGFKDYSPNVKLVSDDNSLGYDILSIENENKKRYIEVKTVKRNDNSYSFHITANEIQKAQQLENYYIYIVVFNKNGHSVKIIDTNNLLESEYFKIVPTDYKIYLNF
ncbi:hypothetical protein TOREUM_20666 [Tenacibaculum litoreum]|uniref:DUF3883 domain-containing protein n=1 Tax=Tenacibaculum litoreum TaxID=321269 RepID=UPI00389354D5